MSAATSPFKKFEDWFKEAKEQTSDYPDAFALSTLSKEGFPASRILLLKKILPKSFVFFTNYQSQKGQELLAKPKASMLFYWRETKKQIRIKGHIQKASLKVSDDYWESRAYQSRLNAFVSQQSHSIELSKEELQAQFNQVKSQFPKQIPRPAHWGGYELTPVEFEFWQEGDFRWHSRHKYLKASDGSWKETCLYP